MAQALIAVALVSGCFLATALLFIPLRSPWGSSRQSLTERGKLDITTIRAALKLYRKREGRYPTTEDGLQALVSSQLLEAIPRDPWGFEYHYALQDGQPILWSEGADGMPGGEGNDADIYSRNLSRPE